MQWAEKACSDDDKDNRAKKTKKNTEKLKSTNALLFSVLFPSILGPFPFFPGAARSWQNDIAVLLFPVFHPEMYGNVRCFNLHLLLNFEFWWTRFLGRGRNERLVVIAAVDKGIARLALLFNHRDCCCYCLFFPLIRSAWLHIFHLSLPIHTCRHTWLSHRTVIPFSRWISSYHHMSYVILWCIRGRLPRIVGIVVCCFFLPPK